MKKKKHPKKTKKNKVKKNVSLNKSSKLSLNPTTAPPENVFDQVLQRFLINVLQKPAGLKIKSTTTLSDFCTDHRFEKEFKEMFIYRTKTFFGVSILHIYNQPILKIIDYLRSIKMKALYFNYPTVF